MLKKHLIPSLLITGVMLSGCANKIQNETAIVKKHSFGNALGSSDIFELNIKNLNNRNKFTFFVNKYPYKETFNLCLEDEEFKNHTNVINNINDCISQIEIHKDNIKNNTYHYSYNINLYDGLMQYKKGNRNYYQVDTQNTKVLNGVLSKTRIYNDNSNSFKINTFEEPIYYNQLKIIK